MTGTLDSGERVVAGRYRLRERLGSGGMGTVWRGEDALLGRDVAVKEITFPSGASDGDRAVISERIRREARAAAQIDHPGAVTIHDVVEEGVATYLVMQYVPSRTLSEIIERDGPLSPQLTARVGLTVLGALRAAHARGILHRDVKPSNVLLSRQDGGSPGRVLLTDFGIASAPGDSSLTSTGLLVGSPHYIAPERARGDVPGPASDLWSLGATLFTAVEGRPPYDGGDPMATLTAVMVGDHAPYVRAGRLQPVLARLLERDPARRVTAAAVETALGEVAASPVSSAVTPPPPGAANLDAAADTAELHVGARSSANEATRRPQPVDQRASRSGRRTRWLAAAGLALAVVLVLAVSFVLTSGDQPPAGLGATGSTGAAGSTSSTDSSGLPPLPATAETPSEQLSATITALADRAARDPDGFGPDAERVLDSLRNVESLEGAPRRSAAVVANTAAGAAVAAGELDAGVGQRVQEVLDSVARPERLVDLVELVAVDPSAIGASGPELLEPLVALDHEVTGDEIAASAATLLESVTDGAEAGELSEAFRRAAVPKLQQLADPAAYNALQDLVADVEDDPSRIGPSGQLVLESLRDIAQLPVFDQGNEARELLGLIQEDGRVPPAFRDAAIPVLAPLVR